MEENMDIKWYIKETDGKISGPYTSQVAAEQACMLEGIKGIVVAGTKDGRQMLLG